MKSYTGPDASKIFVEMLEKDIKIIANIPKKNAGYVKENSMIIRILRLETTVILLVGIGEPHTTHVILSIEYLNLHL